MYQTIAVAGLGLIGGSLCKAIKEWTEARVIGFNRTEKTLEKALEDGAIDEIGTSLENVDLLLLGLYPGLSVQFVEDHIKEVKKGLVVIDTCGVKGYVCDRLAPLAAANGFEFIGGHPMAGREFSGYTYALKDLFVGASMILTPTEASSEETLVRAEAFFSRLGFARVVRTTPENHDRMIAFTSQLAHIVSSAYIKSPEADRHAGYSAGSYKDLTRVARLNETMWTELFLDNREALVAEIDEIIRHLAEYREAVSRGDAETLTRLLREGRERKERIG